MRHFTLALFALALVLFPTVIAADEGKDGGGKKEGDGKHHRDGHHKKDGGERGDGDGIDRLKKIFAEKHKHLIEKWNAAEGEKKEKLAALLRKKWEDFLAHFRKKMKHRGDGEGDGRHKKGDGHHKKGDGKGDGHHKRRDGEGDGDGAEAKKRMLHRLRKMFAEKYKDLIARYHAAEGEEKAQILRALRKHWGEFVSHAMKRVKDHRGEGHGKRDGHHGEKKRHGEKEKEKDGDK